MAVKKVKEVKKGKKFRWRGFEEEQDRRERVYLLNIWYGGVYAGVDAGVDAGIDGGNTP